MVFPLIRHLSATTTRALARLPVTPNQITFVSLVSGVLAAWQFSLGDMASGIHGALFLIVSYVLDNCDGEIARLRNQTSNFGRHFDDVSDWLVHGLLFLGIGHGVQSRTGDDIWWWLGVVAALGATINYFAVRLLEIRQSGSAPEPPVADTPQTEMPRRPVDAFGFIFRELFRADFCFLLLALAVCDCIWLILPAAAIGAQVYWIGAFAKRARSYHV